MNLLIQALMSPEASAEDIRKFQNIFKDYFKSNSENQNNVNDVNKVVNNYSIVNTNNNLVQKNSPVLKEKNSPFFLEKNLENEIEEKKKIFSKNKIKKPEKSKIFFEKEFKNKEFIKEKEIINSTLGYFSLIDGLTCTPKSKYIGGKGTRIPIPPQIINFNIEKFEKFDKDLKNSKTPVKIHIFLLGFNKSTNDMNIVDSLKRITINLSNIFENLSIKDLIVQYPSHKYGKVLKLRFEISINEQIIDWLESASFETITKRGKEKKENKKTKKR